MSIVSVCLPNTQHFHTTTTTTNNNNNVDDNNNNNNNNVSVKFEGLTAG
jgi:hypothetical protein